MKLSILTILLLVSNCLLSQGIIGIWYGELELPTGNLELVFDLEKDVTGYSGTLEVEQQELKGVSLSYVNYENGMLSLHINELGIKYLGELDDSPKISGIFEQNGISLPLILKRTKPIENRFQEQLENKNYLEREVSFVSVNDGLELNGTLSIPMSGNNFPAVILISGSGPQDRDYTVFKHKPFLVISDYLVRRGYVVLRYDDRGFDGSKYNFNDTTLKQHSDDVISAVKHLKKYPEIDSTRIGVIGHSIGGNIGALAASTYKSISFLGLLSAAGLRGDKILLDQKKSMELKMGIDSLTVAKGQETFEAAYDLIINHGEPVKELQESLEKLLSLNTFKSGDSKKKEPIILQLTSHWFMDMVKHDPYPTFKKVNCPVLIFYGDKDVQVSCQENLKRIELALVAGGNKNFQKVILPGINHMLQECTLGLPSEYGRINQTVSPKILIEISTWLNKILGYK